MFYRPLAPALAIALAILGLYSIPGSELQNISYWDLLQADKLAHSGIFTLFTVSLLVAFRRQTKYSGLRARYKTIAIVVSLLYGAFLEYLQSAIIAERTGDVLDFVANGMGAFLGLLLFRLIYGAELTR